MDHGCDERARNKARKEDNAGRAAGGRHLSEAGGEGAAEEDSGEGGGSRHPPTLAGGRRFAGVRLLLLGGSEKRIQSATSTEQTNHSQVCCAAHVPDPDPTPKGQTWEQQFPDTNRSGCASHGSYRVQNSFFTTILNTLDLDSLYPRVGCSNQ